MKKLIKLFICGLLFSCMLVLSNSICTYANESGAAFTTEENCSDNSNEQLNTNESDAVFTTGEESSDNNPDNYHETSENQDNTEQDNDGSFDWIKDLIIPCLMEFLGAFLGFLCAIYLSNRENKKKAKDLKEGLEAELRVMYEELKKRTNNPQKVDYYKYRTPKWDISIRSGVFSQLDSTDYSKYIEIYADVEYAREIENDWWLAKVYGNDKGVIDILQTQRIKCASNIMQLINITLEMDKKNEHAAERSDIPPT